MRRGLLVAGIAGLAVTALVLTVLVASEWSTLLAFDRSVERSVHSAARSSGLGSAGTTLTHLGDPLVVTVLTAALAGYLATTGRRRTAIAVLAARVVAVLVGSGLKVGVGRTRPVFADAIAHAGGASYPSGHALGSAMLWGTVAVVLMALPRWLRLSLAIAVPVLVAATRVVIGVHYPSDVVGGLLIGWALAGLLAVLPCRLTGIPRRSPSIAPTEAGTDSSGTS